MRAHDLYAEVNPAFGIFLAVGFCRSYAAYASHGAALPLLYLALPIAMSDDVEHSFAATNARTGLLAWLHRVPQLQVEFGVRIDAAMPIVSSALRLGLISKALVLDDAVRLGIGEGAPSSRHVAVLPDTPKLAIRRAERLGGWMARSGSAGSIFAAFGVAP